ncbi:MAG: O-antigen ligase family protein [Gammaproteobacteria bacterium]|nr:O-antigen ligase family protein [Gammaproteobacteria bacterium]
MDFLYSFLTFLQPGVLWPSLDAVRPILAASVLAALSGVLMRNPVYARGAVFGHPAFFYLGVFILAQVVSVHYSGTPSMLKEFAYWQVYLFFVVISLLLIHDASAFKRYVWGIIAGGMVIVLYGLYAVQAQLPAAVGGRAGAYGMYENHNDYSFVIILLLPFIYVFWREQRGFTRLLLLLSLAACITGMFLSLSRGGMLALVLECVLIGVFFTQGAKRIGVLLLMCVIGTVAIGYQWEKRAENQGSSYTAEDAKGQRTELWRTGLKMVKRHPLLGVGSRRFGEYTRRYAEISYDNWGKNSHNTYVEIAATSGLVGFISFVFMLWHMFRELLKPLIHPDYAWLEAVRTAALVSLCSLALRALLDAKPHDWGFYVLCALAITYAALRRALENNIQEPGIDNPSLASAARPDAVPSGNFLKI